MFNSGNAMPSLSDIAAVVGNNNDGFGGNNGWWILIILFALWGGFGGYGYGYGGGGSQGAADNYVLASDFATLQRQIDSASSEIRTGINALGNGLSSLGYDQLSQFNGINSNIANLGFQLQQCCCDNKSQIAQVRYDMATGNCAITNAINNAAQQIMQNDNANYRQLHDENVAIQMSAKDDKIAELTALLNNATLKASQADQNNYLLGELKQCPKPAYIVANPYVTPSTCCGCGYTA